MYLCVSHVSTKPNHGRLSQPSDRHVYSANLWMASVIEGLCARNLEHLVVDIFLGVSSRDLLSVKLVCKAWRDFVHKWIEHSVPGRERLKQKLLANWRDPTPIRVSSFRIENEIPVDLKCDAHQIVMGTAKGDIIIIDRTTMKLTFCHTFTGNLNIVQLDFNVDHIVAVSSDGKIVLIQRNLDDVPKLVVELLTQKKGEGTPWSVRIWKTLVAIGASDGSIHVYQIETKRLKTLRILRHHTRGVWHLGFDHGCIVSGSQKRSLRVYDYHKGNTVRSLTAPFDICRVTFVHPIVAACSGGRCDTSGVQIWSLDQEPGSDALRYFAQDCLGIKMTRNHLAIALRLPLWKMVEEMLHVNCHDIVVPYKLKVWRIY